MTQAQEYLEKTLLTISGSVEQISNLAYQVDNVSRRTYLWHVKNLTHTINEIADLSRQQFADAEEQEVRKRNLKSALFGIKTALQVVRRTAKEHVKFAEELIALNEKVSRSKYGTEYRAHKMIMDLAAISEIDENYMSLQTLDAIKSLNSALQEKLA